MSTASSLIQSATQAIALEVEAINHLKQRIDQRFAEACQLILNCSGRVVVVGMGTSGPMERKITATLTITYTPAFFVHPA